MKFNIVLLPLYFFINILQSKSTYGYRVSYRPTSDLPDYSSENDGNFTVLASDQQTIKLCWTLTDGDIFQDSHLILVRSRCMINAARHTMLRQKIDNLEHPHTQYYETAHSFIRLEEILCDMSEAFTYSTIVTKQNELKIFINQPARLNEVNVIDIEKIPRYERSLFPKKSAKIAVVRSGELHPVISLLDTCIGCFLILEDTIFKRRVRVFWREPLFYSVFVTIFEEKGDTKRMVYEDSKRELRFGSMTTTIGPERHRFILQFFNVENGNRESLKVVWVPPQYELRKQLTDVVKSYDHKSNTHILQWPADDSIVDYTLFLVDGIDEKKVTRISDFVYLPSNVTRVELKGDRYLPLGLSGNTRDTSTGVQIFV